MSAVLGSQAAASAGAGVDANWNDVITIYNKAGSNLFEHIDPGDVAHRPQIDDFLQASDAGSWSSTAAIWLSTRSASTSGTTTRWSTKAVTPSLMSARIRIHSVIEDGIRAPNVVPPEATIWYFVRAPKREQVDAIYARMLDCAKGAALMTNAEALKSAQEEFKEKTGGNTYVTPLPEDAVPH